MSCCVCPYNRQRRMIPLGLACRFATNAAGLLRLAERIRSFVPQSDHWIELRSFVGGPDSKEQPNSH
jgi:hypothetical protein